MASGPITSWQIDGEQWKQWETSFRGLQNHCRWWLHPWNKKTLTPWKKSYDPSTQHIKKQRHYFVKKVSSRQWHPIPVLLPRKPHGWRSLVGCSPWGRLESDILSDFHFTFRFHALEREMATHSSVLAWRVPGMGEPGGLPSMGSHRVGHDWSYFAATVKAMALPVGMYGCQSWTAKKSEPRRNDAFELWCWRRLLRVSWTARGSTQSILKEINPEYS